MKMYFEMTAAEVEGVVECCKELIPCSVNDNWTLPEPGNEKVTKIFNKKTLIATSEDNEKVTMSIEIEPEYMVMMTELITGFSQNIIGACKALAKHYKVLVKIAGATELVETINGLVVGKDINCDGSPIEKDEEHEVITNDDTEEASEEITEEPVMDVKKPSYPAADSMTFDV